MKGDPVATAAQATERRAAWEREDCDRCAGASLTPPLTGPGFAQWRSHQDPPLPPKLGKGRRCPRLQLNPQGSEGEARTIAGQQGEIVRLRREVAHLRGLLQQIVQLGGQAGPPPASLPGPSRGGPEPAQGAPNPPVVGPNGHPKRSAAMEARLDSLAPPSQGGTPGPLRSAGQPGGRSQVDLDQARAPNLAEPLNARQRAMLQAAAAGDGTLDYPTEAEGQEDLAGLVARSLVRLPIAHGERPRLTLRGKVVANAGRTALLEA